MCETYKNKFFLCIWKTIASDDKVLPRKKNIIVFKFSFLIYPEGGERGSKIRMSSSDVFCCSSTFLVSHARVFSSLYLYALQSSAPEGERFYRYMQVSTEKEMRWLARRLLQSILGLQFNQQIQIHTVISATNEALMLHKQKVTIINNRSLGTTHSLSIATLEISDIIESRHCLTPAEFSSMRKCIIFEQLFQWTVSLRLIIQTETQRNLCSLHMY